jgi:hypothetical protein
MSHAIQKEIKDEEIIEFTKRVRAFFFSTQHDEFEDGSSRSGKLVELCDYVLDDEMTKEQLLRYMEKTRDSLKASWSSIVQKYAEIELSHIR